jgi:tetratricopeptide (TPR) repeat protein
VQIVVKQQSNNEERGKMKSPSMRYEIGISVVVLLVALAFAAISYAEQGAYGQQSPSQQPSKPDASGQKGQPEVPKEVPKVDPKEQADYKAFFEAQDPDKKVQLGQDFLQKYPMSQYATSVYSQLVNAYFTKQDWNNLYDTADKAIAKNPDDVDVLTLVGWIIPHTYRSDDPDGEKKLDKAVTYEKHALEVIPTLPKPATLTDEQFAAAKADRLAQAHSGLGLVYFRHGDYENSVKELQQATKAAGAADATDFYVLGFSLQKLNRNSEAADAYLKCGQIPGALQDRCKQSVTQAQSAK